MKDGFRTKDVIACASLPCEGSSWCRRDKIGTSGEICGAADGGAYWSTIQRMGSGCRSSCLQWSAGWAYLIKISSKSLRHYASCSLVYVLPYTSYVIDFLGSLAKYTDNSDSRSPSTSEMSMSRADLSSRRWSVLTERSRQHEICPLESTAGASHARISIAYGRQVFQSVQISRNELSFSPGCPPLS
jgi:hypothetical protein